MNNRIWFYSNLIFVGFSMCAALLSTNDTQITFSCIFILLWAFMARVNYVDAVNDKRQEDEKYDEACKLLYNIILVKAGDVEAEADYQTLLNNTYALLKPEQQHRFRVLSKSLERNNG